MTDVAVDGSSSVLAIGDLVERWSGSSRRAFNGLGAPSGVASTGSVVSPDDLWLVALENVAHWDGRSWQWTKLPAPNDTVDGGYGGISATADDVWVVGGFERINGTWFGVNWHFNGQRWTRSSSQTRFEAVSALSPTDVWAVGYLEPVGLGHTPAEIGHWNGTHWDRRPYDDAGSLNAVQAISPTDVWAVGNKGILDDGEIAVHWDGMKWTNVGPRPVAGRTLRAVAVLNDQDVWAVGSTFHEPPPGKYVGTYVPLIEHYACSA